METSDSDEYFESADEDFYSDQDENDEESIKISNKTTNNKELTVNLNNLNDSDDISNKTDNRISSTKNNNFEDIGDTNVKNIEKLALSECTNQVSDLESQESNKNDVELNKNPVSITETPDTHKTIDNLVDVKETDINDFKETSSNDIKTTQNTMEEPNLWEDTDLDWAIEPDHSPQTQKAEKENSVIEDGWDNNDWEPLNYEEAVSKKEETSPTWSSTWGSWGVSSLLTTATQSVTTLTSHVSQGLTTVLETGIGAPDPEELAKIDRTEDETSSSAFGLGNFSNLVSGVITGGLDTLETIGKKTMEVLQDGDPGLKKKRAFLKLDSGKPVLSQVLREAKERSEASNTKSPTDTNIQVKKRRINYETLFDDHQGLVHLEALELLSKLCTIKLQNITELLSGDKLTDMNETMEQVRELCELPEEDDDTSNHNMTIDSAREVLEGAVSDMKIPISCDKVINTWKESEEWLNITSNCDIDELHEHSIEALAQITAEAVEQFHKAGELLLVKDHRSTADEADSLVQFTTVLKSIVLVIANKFTEKLNSKASANNTDNKKMVNDLITNVFFEAANSCSYIQDALQLLVPVLQVGAI